MKKPEESPVTGRRSLKPRGENGAVQPDFEPDLLESDNNGRVFPVNPISNGGDGTSDMTQPSSAYSRSPRDYVPFPKSEVVIQSPGRAEDPPDSSILQALIPLAGSLTGIILTVLAANTSNTAIMYVSLPMIVFSVIGGVLRNSQQRKKYEQKISKREQLFHAHLKETEDTLERLVEEQRKASLVPNPGLAECFRRVESHNSRLWERKPEDPDFLDVRLGTGKAPPTFVVKPPASPEAVQEPDELFKKALCLADRYSIIENVAITLPLRKVVTAGLLGSRSYLIETSRSMLIHIATHHAPSEVKLVLCLAENEIKAWDWARWLPHTWRDDHQVRMIAGNDNSTLQILEDLEQVLKRRKNDLAVGSDDTAPTPALVFVFANPGVWNGEDANIYKPLLDMLLKEGEKLGAYSIFLHEKWVPKDCGAVITVTDQYGSLKVIGPSPELIEFFPDTIEKSEADRFARKLAGIRTEQGPAGSAELPKSIPLLDLLGVKQVSDLNIAENWEKTKFDKTLSVPLGIGTGGKVVSLDMHERAQGPHGLLAGASGSGKSELLQALITSLSLRYSPEKVAFILIDYKSTTVQPFLELPHQLGIITNLSGNLATRARIGLKAEIARRELLFKKEGVSEFDNYQNLYFSGLASEPLPHLFIIVDEFAELKGVEPDFIPGLVSISMLGRQFGIHLILATQKPAGVVNEQIWANAKARICLRVERTEDSQDVLKRPDAYSIRVENIGRGYFQVGNNEIFEQLQVAWASAPYAVAAGQVQIDPAVMVDLDGSLRPLSLSVNTITQVNPPSQMKVIISDIINTAERKGLQPAKRPWLPPLENVYYLKDHHPPSGGWDGNGWIQTGRWLSPFIGVYDDPEGQTHGDLSLPLGSEGNLCIYGAPGSGKTNLVQTIITSLVLDHSPQELNIYILDFGGRSYKAFEALPHMGAIVLPDETDRVHRLLLYLKQELERRKKIMEPFGGKIADYRQHTKGELADIILFLDNYSAFSNSFNDQVMDLVRLASEGGNLGMHLVLTNNSIGGISMALASSISQAIALELVDKSDYISVVGRTKENMTPPRDIPGRGLIKGSTPLEFQTALALEKPTELINLFNNMKAVYPTDCARRVPPIQEVIPLSAVLTPGDMLSSSTPDSLSVPVGLDLSTPGLDCFSVDLGKLSHIWIAGPPSSGKTTLLQTWAFALTELISPKNIKLYLVDMGCSSLAPFSQLPQSSSYVITSNQFDSVLQELNEQLDERAQEKKNAIQNKLAGNVTVPETQLPELVMLIENLEDFRRETSESSRLLLSNLMRRKGLGFHVIATGASQDFSTFGHPDNLGNVFKENITGFLIGYNNYDDLQYLPLKLAPSDIQKNLPPGTAFFVQRGGRYCTVQVASCHHEKPDFQEWMDHVSSKWMNFKTEPESNSFCQP